MRKILFITAVSLLMFSCNCDKKKEQKETPKKEPVSAVMTKEMQEKMTPDDVLKDLMDGNKNYIAGKLTHRDLPKQIKSTTDGQYPKAVILTCIDSRVPIKYIFDQGIGDVFVVKVAGNIEDVNLLGSMEYGLGVAGCKLLMVLGHQNCGAVKSAIKKVDVGSANVTALLNEIEPAIQEVEGERDYKNKEYFKKVVENNVHQTIEDIKKRSNIIRNLEKEGKIKIVGAYYSLKDGKVTLLSDDPHPSH